MNFSIFKNISTWVFLAFFVYIGYKKYSNVYVEIGDYAFLIMLCIVCVGDIILERIDKLSKGE